MAAEGEKVADLMAQLTTEQVTEVMNNVFEEMLGGLKVRRAGVGKGGGVFYWIRVQSFKVFNHNGQFWKWRSYVDKRVQCFKVFNHNGQFWKGDDQMCLRKCSVKSRLKG